MVEPGLRPMPPFERHEKIFQMWAALSSGETLRIINDHGPKPLHYQFETEYKGQYEWEYERKVAQYLFPDATEEERRFHLGEHCARPEVADFVALLTTGQLEARLGERIPIRDL